MKKIAIGISACLLGESVRYDGGHMLDCFLRDTLGKYVHYVPVCPEVECGFGVPREALRLVGNPKRPRLMTSTTKIDYTDRMENWAKERVKELEKASLCGFIFKSDSPSSGIRRVKVYDDNGIPRKIGVGIFARIFMEHFPLTPVEEEGRLHDPSMKENFIERVFTYRHYREAVKKKGLIRNLAVFHTRHKLLFMARGPKYLKQMGNLVAQAKQFSPKEFIMQYEKLFLKAMAIKPSVAKHANVLHHIMGYFKKILSAGENQELIEVIDEYRQGLIPLIVPVTLMKHYVRRYNEVYLKEQVYLNPHPLELHLRNHV